MPRDRGLAAIRLEMPDTIPHTEYVSNPKLIERVTGLPADNPDAGPEFYRRWKIDYMWRTDSPPFPNSSVKMRRRASRSCPPVAFNSRQRSLARSLA